MRNKARISLLTVLLLTAPAFAFEENSLDLGRFDRVDLEAGLFSRGEGPRLGILHHIRMFRMQSSPDYSFVIHQYLHLNLP